MLPFSVYVATFSFSLLNFVYLRSILVSSSLPPADDVNLCIFSFPVAKHYTLTSTESDVCPLLPKSPLYFHMKFLLSLAKTTVVVAPHKTTHRAGIPRRLVKVRFQGPILT